MIHKATKIDPATRLKRKSSRGQHWFWLYRGCEIHISREMCVAGYKLVYYSVFHGTRELNSGYTDSSERVPSLLKSLKKTIDRELNEVL